MRCSSSNGHLPTLSDEYKKVEAISMGLRRKFEAIFGEIARRNVKAEKGILYERSFGDIARVKGTVLRVWYYPHETLQGL